MMDHAGHRPASTGRNWLGILEWTAIGVTGAIILAPYVLPAAGIGTAVQATEAMSLLHSTVDNGDGLAGFINKGLALIPGIGETLAKGGWPVTGIAAATGVGGGLLGHFIADRSTMPRGVFIGQAIAVAGLATSMLVSLPTILTGVSAGMVFLSGLWSNDAATFALNHFPVPQIGSVGAVEAVTGASVVATVSRLLACCLPAMPIGMALMIQQKKVPGEVVLHVMGERGGKMLVQLRDAKGRPLGEDRLQVKHEHAVHLMALDSAMGEYHHLHPEPTGKPGEYAVDLLPDAGKRYHLWADVTPIGSDHSVTPHTVIGQASNEVPATVPTSRQADAGGLHFAWAASAPLRSGESSVVDIKVTDAAGRPVSDLEPVMGAAAHLVGFSADHASMTHLHPVSSEDGRLRFHVEPSHEGPTKFFLQVKRQGRIETAAFGEKVYPAKTTARTLSEPSRQHAHAR